MSIAKYHLQRIRAATTQRLGRKDVAQWICDNTYLNGHRYSFKDHEFQERILQEEGPEVTVIKSAQMGCSELMLRLSAALPMIMPGAFRLAYVLPTATFASSYAQTRFNPIISGSPALRAAVSKDDVDKVDTKTFGSSDKVVYFKGAATGNAAISTTLDALVIDERSFCDDDVIGDYHSRVIHSPYKWRFTFSTPTHPGDAISREFEHSRQYRNLCRCVHCQHVFLPDYYEQVIVPGWDKGLDEITQSNLHRTRHEEAYLACPKCKKPADLGPAHRFWHCSNPEDNFRAVGFQIQPFDAPKIITISDLVIASTKYKTPAKFKQFSLGRPAIDQDSGLTEEDIERCGYEGGTSPFTSHVMGIDQGNTCHFRVGGVNNDGQLVEVHRERSTLANFKTRYAALKAQYRVTAVVLDQQPNVSLAMEMAEADSQCYPALYSTKQGMDVFDIRSREAEPDAGIMALRQLSVSRNALFDRLMAEIRLGNIKMKRDAEWDTMKTHMVDMKRAEATLRNGEFASLWVKTKGNDHYHHALGYLWLAAQLRGIVSTTVLPSMFTVQKFKVTEPKSRRA